MNEPHSSQKAPPSPPAHRHRRAWTWFWIILKNVIGWLLMLAAWPIGILLPGPGGIPLFLIGFALVTFPGKRRFTARVLRGRRLNLNRTLYTLIAAVIAILTPPLLFWYLLTHYLPVEEVRSWGTLDLLAICLLVMGIIWLLARLSFRLLSWLLVLVPRIRRRTRPWLNRHGVRLLPPRWRRHHPLTGLRHRHVSEEILLFHERHGQRLRRVWKTTCPWLWGATAALVVLAIIYLGFHVMLGWW